MTHWATYVISLLALAVALWEVGRAARALRLPRVLTLFTAGCLIIYVASLVPGAVGFYTAWSVAGGIVLLSLLTVLGMRKLVKYDPSRPLQVDERQTPALLSGPWSPVTVLFCVVAALACFPLIRFALQQLSDLRNTHIKINFDGVSYHLPSFIDYAQRKTFWYTGGPFASYSYAYEMVYGFPMLFHKTHWSLVLVNALAVAFMVAAIFHLSAVLTRAANQLIGRNGADGNRGPINPLFVALAATAAWGLAFGRNIDDLAKNDVFLGACTTGALALLLDWAMETPGSKRRAMLMAMAVAAMGLAVGTKATALLFLPAVAFVAMMAAARPGPAGGPSRVAAAIGAGFVVTAGALLIGGFWYVRNYVVFGHIVEPGNERGFKMSLLHNLADGRLYRIHRDSIATAIALLSPLVLLSLVALWRRTRGSSERANATNGAGVVIGGLLVVQLAGLAILLVTPFFLFRVETWFTRLAIVQFTVAGVILALLVGTLVAWLPRGDQTRPVEYVRRPMGGAMLARAVGLGAAVILLGLAVVLPWHWDRKHRAGMPGWERIYSQPRAPETQVYATVQGIAEGKRIYAAGVRPYGMYGRNWQHMVWYDSHSHVLADERPVFKDADPLFYDSWQDVIASGTPRGPARLLTIVKNFRADLLVLAVENDDHRDPPKIPLDEWTRQQSDWLVEVYRDPIAVVYEVRGDGWRKLLGEYNVGDKLPRMAW